MTRKCWIRGKIAVEVAKRYGISRITLYKWIKRYKESGDTSNKTPHVDHYYHETPDKYVDAVLAMVAVHPEYGIRSIVRNLPKVGLTPIVGHHGVQNILRRHGLLHYIDRKAYAQAQITPVTISIHKILEAFLSFFKIDLTSRQKIVKSWTTIVFGSFAIVVALGLSGFLATTVFATAGVSKIGLMFATLALFMGSVFFLYSFKYYITLAIVLSYSQTGPVEEGEGRKQKGGLLSRILGLSGSNQIESKMAPGLEPDLSHIILREKPFVSVQIPFYNEKNVVRRSIEAAINFNYPKYEVILCDDSTDETTSIISAYMKDYLSPGEHLKEIKNEEEGWVMAQVDVKPGVTLKHLHRTTRSGYKGKALDLALKLTDPRAKFISIFDADFVPYPDSLELFQKYFQESGDSRVAAVQGYQWHVLNKSENWITRGIRSEYAGSYVVERSGVEIYGGLKQISGSVYMIRRDALESVGWGSSITEDFELTLKLYEKGYKVLYTPYVQAPAECVSTIRRLVRQRMRWAEGHSFNVKKMFVKLMTSPKLTFAEKFEFAYLSPYYLQAFFFLVGTLAWLMSEAVFKSRLPFWTELWGWSLVLTNMFALPLVNGVGLFVEESEERDYLGLGSFIALSYLLVPFQAYAAVKGLIEEKEGPWFRTPKTGRITDIFSRGRFYRFIAGILPGAMQTESSPYLALTTANSKFNDFVIKPVRISWLGKAVLSSLLIITTSFMFLTRGVTSVYATNMAGPLKLGVGAAPGGTTPTWGNYMQDSTSYSTGSLFLLANLNALGSGTNNYAWYTQILPTGYATTQVNGALPSGAYYLQMAKMNGGPASNFNFGVQLLLTNNNGTARTQLLGSTFMIETANVNNTLFQYSLGSLASTQSINYTNPNRISLRVFWVNGSNTNGNVNLMVNNGTVPMRLVTPGSITVPEIPKVTLFVIIMIIIPVAPSIIEGRFRKKKGNIFQEVGDSWRDLLDKLFGDETEKALDELPV